MRTPMKKARIEQELTQLDLYEQTGIKPFRISLYERGLIPTQKEAEKLSKALDIPITDIIDIYKKGA